MSDRSAGLHADLDILAEEQDYHGTHSGLPLADQLPGQPPLHFASVRVVELIQRFYAKLQTRLSDPEAPTWTLSFCSIFSELDPVRYQHPPGLPDKEALPRAIRHGRRIRSPDIDAEDENSGAYRATEDVVEHAVNLDSTC